MPPARLDSLRGHGLAQYVMVEARDHYRVVLAIVEFADDFTSRPLGSGDDRRRERRCNVVRRLCR